LTPPAGERLKVLIADDDPLVRRLVRDTLEPHGIVVVAEAGTWRETVELSLHYRPAVVLTDLLMPGGEPLDGIRQIATDAGPAVSVIVFSSSWDDDVAVAALRAGASGFLRKDMDLARLPLAIEAAARGEPAISRRLASVLVACLRGAPTAGVGVRPVRSTLSNREWQVFDLMCDGVSTTEMALALGISTETVRSHVKRILRKVGARDRNEAVAIAARLRAPIGDQASRSVAH
jgi:DNA-binding NarL/FixJ family response regulator